MNKIGFIGTGNIARAIISGLVENKIDVSNIYVSGKSGEAYPKSKERLRDDYGVKCAENNGDLVNKCDIVIIALEPKVYKFVAPEIKEHIRKDQIFVSLAPNYSTKEIMELLGEDIKIARTIPNIPATVGKSMAGMAFAEGKFDEKEKEAVINFFKQIGRVEVLQEKYIDMIPAVSGSAPAYMYMVIEAMADAAVLIGFPRQMAYSFASQVMIGAGTMVQKTGMHPCELRDFICSPGGTTIEAIKVLEKTNFRNNIIEAMLACYDKSQKLK